VGHPHLGSFRTIGMRPVTELPAPVAAGAQRRPASRSSPMSAEFALLVSTRSPRSLQAPDCAPQI